MLKKLKKQFSATILKFKVRRGGYTMLEVKEMVDYMEIKNNLYEERINEKEECTAIVKYIQDAGIFLEEDFNEALKELDYKKEDIDNWYMLRTLLNMLKMEYIVSTIGEYLERFKECYKIPENLEKHIDDASILYEAIQGNSVIVFRQGHTCTVLEVIYPYQ